MSFHRNTDQYCTYTMQYTDITSILKLLHLTYHAASTVDEIKQEIQLLVCPKNCYFHLKPNFT